MTGDGKFNGPLQPHSKQQQKVESNNSDSGSSWYGQLQPAAVEAEAETQDIRVRIEKGRQF